MSFILDALRKSESRRNMGQTPGLETSQAPARRRRRRPGALAVLLGLAVVVVVVVAGVVLTGPEWIRDELAARIGDGDEAAAPAGEEVPEVVGVPGEILGERLAVRDDTSAREPSGSEAGGADPDDRPVDRQPAEAAGESNESDESAERTGRRRSRPAAPENRVSRPAPQRESPPAGSEEAAAALEQRIAETRARLEAAENAAEPDEATVPDPATDRQPQAEPAARGPEAPEYVRAWELPLSARRNLPELNLSLHVFSPSQGERFVLINGERYMAGDRIEDGMRLVDIRREGAIIDFKEHRFLLEP